jgi:hypothetical protein
MMMPPPERQEPPEEIPDHARTYHLVLKPVVSGTDGSTSFGYYYCEDYGDERSDSCKHFTLGDCQKSAIQLQTAAGKIAITWMRSQQRNLFNHICNFRFMNGQLDHYGVGYVKLRGRNTIQFSC